MELLGSTKNNITEGKNGENVEINRCGNEDVEITTHKKRYISPEERQQIIDELRLIPRNY